MDAYPLNSSVVALLPPQKSYMFDCLILDHLSDARQYARDSSTPTTSKYFTPTDLGTDFSLPNGTALQPPLASSPAKHLMASQWTPEKVRRIVTDSFIRDSLPEEDHDELDKSAGVESGQSDETYINCIRETAPRLFLILVQVGAPERIFEIIDQAYDDEDLPLNVADIARLELSADRQDFEINGNFARSQTRFLAPPAPPAPTVVGTKGATKAVNKLAIEVVTAGNDTTDVVRIVGNRSKVFTRRRVVFSQPPMFTREDDFLEDVKFVSQKLRHQHFAAIKTAYTAGQIGFVLIRPVINISLRAFMTSTPKRFKSIPFETQQMTLLNWPHCLASATTFLHNQGLFHGNITPSNVFIDNMNRIYLGFPVSVPAIQGSEKGNKAEAERYSPPERGARASPHYPDIALHSSKSTKKRSFFKSKSSRGSSGSDKSTPSLSSLSIQSTPAEDTQSVRASVEYPDSWPLPALAEPLNSTEHPHRSSIISPPPRSSTVASPPPSSTVQSPYQSTVSSPTPSIFDASSIRAPSIMSASTGASLPHSEVTSLEPSQIESSQRGDTFSLACITIDVLNLLLHGKGLQSSSSGSSSVLRKDMKSRLFGGLGAEVNYRSNSTAVAALVNELEKTAASKPGVIFRGVPTTLQLVRRMMSVEPGKRPGGIEVVKTMEKALLRDSELPFMHCGGAGGC